MFVFLDFVMKLYLKVNRSRYFTLNINTSFSIGGKRSIMISVINYRTHAGPLSLFDETPPNTLNRTKEMNFRSFPFCSSDVGAIITVRFNDRVVILTVLIEFGPCTEKKVRKRLVWIDHSVLYGEGEKNIFLGSVMVNVSEVIFKFDLNKKKIEEENLWCFSSLALGGAWIFSLLPFWKLWPFKAVKPG